MNNAISIVIAVKNEEKYLSDALNSILKQENVDIEVILVNDNSTDNTFDIALGISKFDNRLKVYSNPRKGKVSAFNYGITKSQNDFICLFAGDDIMPEGSLSKRLERLINEDHSLPVITLSKIKTFSAISKFNGILIPKKNGASSLSGVSPLMNKSAIDLIFPVPESLPNEDTWMELSILHLKNIKVIYSDIISCNYRIHEGNSINMLTTFEIYNKKFNLRMSAMPIFLEKYQNFMQSTEIRKLNRKMKCEASRMNGNVMGIIASRASIRDVVRSISTSSNFFYNIRKFFFKYFTGI